MESLSDQAAIARWKTTMKGGDQMTVVKMTKPFRFVEAWPAEVKRKSGNEGIGSTSMIDPWGQRHRR